VIDAERAAARARTDEVAAVVADVRALVHRPGPIDPRRLARLGRALVRAAETGDAAFLGLTALAEGQRDPAGRTAHLLLLSLGAAREITTSRRALVQLAQTVLLAELGDPAAADPDVALSPALARAPGAAAAGVVAVLGARPAALAVAESAFEAAWLRHEHAFGPLPFTARVAARLLHVARAYLDRVAPPDGTAPISPLEALVQVGRLDSVDPASYRCLVRALGSTPAGLVVELDTGEWAVVLPPYTAEDPGTRPRLRLLTDPRGRALQPAPEVDLADAAHAGRHIVRVVDPSAASGIVAAAFLGA
jgi:hypothetical protein